jgi:hypothetical protein
MFQIDCAGPANRRTMTSAKSGNSSRENVCAVLDRNPSTPPAAADTISITTVGCNDSVTSKTV